MPATRTWRLSDRRTQAFAAQAGAAVVLVVVAGLVVEELSTNLARLNLSAGFGFLWRPAGMQIGETVIPFDASDSFARAILAATVNTLRVAAAGVVLATVLGTVVGIMRLSTNPLLRAITGTYVELFRNTPLLLQILFWSALVLKLPGVRQAIDFGGWAFLSQRGLQLPTLILGEGWTPVIEWPVRKLFGFAGGMTLTPEFCALLAGLVAYHGSFIAEILRGGILSIPLGQWEAARSLGVHDGTTMRLVILPQVLRVILPAITSQFVGIVKNSSLAIAIGYPDLFWAVSTAINVTGHAIEGVAVMIAAYLVLTLASSGAMNLWYARLLHRSLR